jgi:predicted dienelactone hydrolase
MRVLICLVWVIGVSFPLVRGEGPYKKAVGPNEVDTLLIDWKDGKRERDVPVKLYFPKSGPGPFPVVIFSHGLGGSRQGYEYLGRHWASHGYVCVHVQHRGSDEEVWKGKTNMLAELRKAARVPANAVNRPGDVSFTIDELAKLNKKGKLAGRLDLEKIGLAGHSFGAWTTMACAGQTFFTPLGGTARQAESRIKAAIAMSPSPQAGKIDRKKAYATIKVPLLHLTGTKDDGVGITETKPADRRVPYDHIAAAHQYLVIFEDGDHMVFSGLAKRTRGKGKGEKDARFHDLIRMSSTAFWDAHLKGDSKAREWLTGEFETVLGKDGTFEFKK